jgi:hypothetical protein
MFNQYAFPIDDQTILMFLDPHSNIIDESEYPIEKNLTDLYAINHSNPFVYICDGTDIEENPGWNDLTIRGTSRL